MPATKQLELSTGEIVTIRTLQPGDAEAAVEALLDLAQEEPLNKHLAIPRDAHVSLYQKMVNENMHMGLSFVAISQKTGKIVGITMNDITGEDSDDDESVDCDDYEDNRFRIIEALLDKLDEPVNDEDSPSYLYGSSNSKWLDLALAAVAKDYAHEKLFSNMLQMSFDEAKEKGFAGMTVTCSSEYAYKAAQKLGLKCVNEIAYETYVSSVTNETVFAELAKTTPHKSIKLMHLNFK